MAIKTSLLLDRAAAQLALRPDSTLAVIADAAGVSRTTLFYRFSTREGLLEALALDTLERASEALQAISWHHGDVAGTIRDVACALVPLAPRMQVVLRESPAHSTSEVNARWTEALHPLIHYLDTLQSEQRIRASAPMTWLVTSLVYLLFAAWDAVGSATLTAEHAASLTAETWLRGCSPQESC